MEVVIRSKNGTYYKGRTAIGPCFGATKEQAFKFSTKQEAELERTTHSFAFVGTTIENIKKIKNEKR